ncbi:glycosyltransferase family 71 protein [Xylariaceae sp. FL1272]|nr:glycosyltransferase family 71 protein [Xylariaceae sp. FL1272]
MILGTSLGPKEGRMPPGLLSPVLADRRRRWPNTHLQMACIAFIFLLWCFYRAVVVPQLVVDITGPRIVAGLPIPKQPTSMVDIYSQVPDLPTQGGDPTRRVKKPSSADQKPISADIEDEEAGYLNDPKIKSGYFGKSKSTGDKKETFNPSWNERPGFSHDLDAVVNLLPDEVHMREFLSPIELGGSRRMKELGLRTRAYRQYFDAWEALHLNEDEETGEITIRDDIIQYLRDTVDVSKGSKRLASLIHKYESFRSFIISFARVLFPFTTPYFADHMSLHASTRNGGRGIVITGGDNQARMMLTTIYTYRQLGCDLPIEVMYLGDADLSEDNRLELEALPGVITRDLSPMVDDAGWSLAGWAAKPWAILLSSFREVIMIDADALFFKNPATLFDDPDYIETGALFFRDRVILPESKRSFLQQMLPRPISKHAIESRWWQGTSGHHQESGVVVVDKWKHFISLLLVCRFNGSDRDTRDGKKGVYELVYGDKETFWVGFLLAGDESFAFHKGFVGILGAIESDAKKDSETKEKTPESSENPPSNTESTTPTSEATPSSVVPATSPETHVICAPQLLHTDTDGSPLWFNGWLLANKFDPPGKQRYMKMDSYLLEPKPIKGEDSFWRIAQSNICCLTSTPKLKYDMEESDKKILKMIIERAKEVKDMDF